MQLKVDPIQESLLGFELATSQHRGDGSSTGLSTYVCSVYRAFYLYIHNPKLELK